MRLSLMGKEWCVLLLEVIECVWIERGGWISGKITTFLLSNASILRYRFNAIHCREYLLYNSVQGLNFQS